MRKLRAGVKVSHVLQNFSAKPVKRWQNYVLSKLAKQRISYREKDETRQVAFFVNVNSMQVWQKAITNFSVKRTIKAVGNLQTALLNVLKVSRGCKNELGTES